MGPQLSDRGLDPDIVRFLVMQYLDGETLAARLARAKGPLPLSEALLERAVPSGYHRYYAVSPDGSRILVNEKQSDADRGAITVLLNWPALLKK